MILEIGYKNHDTVVLTFTSGSDKVVFELPRVAPVEAEAPTEKEPLIVLAS